jgi:putative lipoic acid-binding regulatory protein
VSLDPNSGSLLESLETNHEFPGPYTFKAIGGNPESFAQSVLSAIAGELSLASEPPHSLKHTPNGRHVSVTLTLTMETPQHVIKVYSRLQALDDLVMLM